MTEYKWMQVFTRKEYEELKSFQKDMNDALDGIDKAREERYNSGSVTREDIVRLLDRNIKAQADHWGTDYIYTRWARAHKVKALDAYDISLSHEEWAYNNRFISFDPATRTLTGVLPGAAMLVAIAPDGARESFLIQVKQ